MTLRPAAIAQPDWTDRVMKRRTPRPDAADHADINADPRSADRNNLSRMIQQDAPRQMAKGGKVTRTGAIVAHEGEHVVRKAAAVKYGDKKMAAVNKGMAKVTAKGEK